MPGSDTGDLAKTLVRFARKLLSSPTVGNTLESVTFGDTQDVDHLGLLENFLDGHLLLHVLLGPCNLGGRVGSSVELDLHDVCLLLLQVLEQVDLSVCNDTNDLAVLGDLVELLLVRLLTSVGFEHFVVLLESFLLGRLEVLVKAALAGIRKVTTEDGVQLTKTTWGLDISNNSNNHHGRCFNNSDRFNNLFLVCLGTSFVHFTHDVSHTRLVTLERGQVYRCGLVLVTRPRTDLTGVVRAALLGQEAQGAVAWRAKLTMRPGAKDNK